MLRAARPAASDDLVRRLAAQATPMRRPRAPRLAFAGVATAVMLVGLAAIGGVGRAAYEIRHVANIATGQTHTFGTHLAVQLDSASAARAQYNPPTSTSGDTTTATVPANTQSTITTSAGSVTLTSDTAVTAAVSTGLPSSSTSTATLTSGSLENTFVTISLTDASGNLVGQLVAPMTVSLKVATTTSSSSSNTALPTNYAVTFSTNGTDFQSIPACANGQLASGQTACYIVTASSSDRSSSAKGLDSGANIQVLSLKPGIFGVVYKANITTSETGKAVPQAGSGKFGDPTRNHVGAPVLKQVGSKIAPQTSLQATRVPFDFSVDEQAAVYISIYDANGNPVWIRTTGSSVRGHSYSGKAVHALHFVVLRPGQINTVLNVAPGTFKAGQTYKIRITAVDFDGHKVTEYTTFTG